VFHVIAGDLASGARHDRRSQRRGSAPCAGGAEWPQSLIETVLAADIERMQLLAEAETTTIRIASPSADPLVTSTPFRAGACRPRFLQGSVFPCRPRGVPARNSPVAGACGSPWRRVLFAQPDILLLDEPTNYLDLEGTLWLEEHLSRYPHTRSSSATTAICSTMRSIISCISTAAG